MSFLLALWLPIILSAVALFFASFIAWMVLPHHQSDYQRLEDEDRVMQAIRSLNLKEGSYVFPFMSHQDAKDPAKLERYTNGPRGAIHLWKFPNMGRNLGLTFLHFLLIATVAAYIGWASIGPGAGFWKAFQILGAIGVLVFASNGQLNAVWFPRRTANDLVDGIAYGIIMGLIFGLLWPTN